jgi:hypothetical protein
MIGANIGNEQCFFTENVAQFQLSTLDTRIKYLGHSTFFITFFLNTSDRPAFSQSRHKVFRNTDTQLGVDEVVLDGLVRHNEQREKRLQHIVDLTGCSPKQAKNLPITLLYGGNVYCESPTAWPFDTGRSECCRLCSWF